MKDKLKQFLASDQFKEMFLYLVIGVLTTLVSIAVYALATRAICAITGIREVTNAIATVGTVVSHAVAIAFAFVTNKKFVFRTPGWRGRAFWREAWTFTTARLLSLVIDVLFMNFAIGTLHMNDMVAKLIVQVIIIVANYLASKFWVFKKDGRGGRSDT